MVGFDKKIHYTDCKIAYSEPEMLEVCNEQNYLITYLWYNTNSY